MGSIYSDEATHQATFETESLALCRERAMVGCALGIGMVPAFGLLDRLIAPDHTSIFWAMRAVSVLISLAILIVVRTRVGLAWSRVCAALLVLSIGIMIALMTIFTGREASPYYAGINLAIVTTGFLMPWPARWTIAVVVTLVASYVVCTIATGPIVYGELFANNLAFLGSSSLLAVVSTILCERLRAREFRVRRALTRTLRHKSDFLATMSHELRTPLHVMLGYADIMLEDALPEGADDAAELTRQIRTQSLRLHTMISDLLDAAKIDAGQMTMHTDPVRLGSVVDRVVDAFEPIAARKGIALDGASLPDHVVVLTDEQRLTQILTNLVANALKFTERGSVCVEVRELPANHRWEPHFRTLTVEAAAHVDGLEVGPSVAVFVHDTGVGIRTSDLARLAQDFQQLQDHGARFGGTGLGLSISRRLTHLLGGQLHVRSSPGEGSTFVFVLPTHDGDDRLLESDRQPSGTPRRRAA